jgi:hypothetical protein
LERFDKEVKALKEEVLRMCWYMRGGISFSELMEMGSAEREIIAEIIKSNLETTKETRLPFF